MSLKSLNLWSLLTLWSFFFSWSHPLWSSYQSCWPRNNIVISILDCWVSILSVESLTCFIYLFLSFLRYLKAKTKWAFMCLTRNIGVFYSCLPLNLALHKVQWSICWDILIPVIQTNQNINGDDCHWHLKGFFLSIPFSTFEFFSLCEHLWIFW